jgi:hypothetical protein
MNYPEMSTYVLAQTLGLTIKRDNTNKLVTFLCQLTAYTEDAQFNISFNAPSSTGKSYIPMEIAQLFPQADIKAIGYCSPTAFYHDVGQFDKERKAFVVDLARKVLIFLDQPHTMLLERLRPLLSHDQKEMELKITDKSGKGGLKTKTVFIKGFPSVVFCSAGLQIDEQEGTRFWLLSPETNQEKLREAIHARITKETDAEAYKQLIEADPARIALKQRITAIRDKHIDDVQIPFPALVEQYFLDGKANLKPRHQRDVGRLMALIKAIALLNLWTREQKGNVILASEADLNQALAIWKEVSVSQEYNLPPYIYDLYREVILAAYQAKNDSALGEIVGPQGVTRQEVFKKHAAVYGRPIEDFRLRQQVLPMLEIAGLITQEADPNDKRKVLIYPTSVLTISNDAGIVSDTGGEAVVSNPVSGESS